MRGVALGGAGGSGKLRWVGRCCGFPLVAQSQDGRDLSELTTWCWTSSRLRRSSRR